MPLSACAQTSLTELVDALSVRKLSGNTVTRQLSESGMVGQS